MIIFLNRKLFVKRNVVNKIPQGRWGLIRCDVALEKRIALANTDHCGPCAYKDLQLNRNQKIIIDGNGDCRIDYD